MQKLAMSRRSRETANVARALVLTSLLCAAVSEPAQSEAPLAKAKLERRVVAGVDAGPRVSTMYGIYFATLQLNAFVGVRRGIFSYALHLDGGGGRTRYKLPVASFGVGPSIAIALGTRFALAVETQIAHLWFWPVTPRTSPTSGELVRRPLHTVGIGGFLRFDATLASMRRLDLQARLRLGCADMMFRGHCSAGLALGVVY